MKTKEKLQELFENNKNKYFSGEEIAEKLKISRTAVWKAVNVLRAEGYPIDAIQNKGYCLSDSSDILSVRGISKYLLPISSELQATVFPSAASTNTVLREKAELGAPEGTCIIAGFQTEGRGRAGRSFYSPPDTGIYLSLLLRPSHLSAQQAVKITTMAAVAVCRAIEKISPEKAFVKWVNDVYLNGKKVCGILTEAAFSLESGLLNYAVLGVGINIYSPKEGFPKELENVAGAVFSKPQSDGKNRLVAEFVNCFMEIYTAPSDDEYIKEYRSRSFLIGKRVNVISAGKTEPATVLDVDESCCLIVRYDNGEVGRLFSGEVTLDVSGIVKNQEN